MRIDATRGVLALLMAFAPLTAAAQSSQLPDGSRLLVTVTDRSIGAALGGAQVTIENLGLSQRTDSGGTTMFASLPRGVHTVRVRHLGYRVRVMPAGMARGDSLHLVVQLEPLASQLPAVRVAAEGASARFSPGLREFEDRRANRPFGHFLDEEEIRANLGSDLRNFVLSRLPGLRIEPAGPNAIEHFAFSSRGPSNIRGGPCRADVYIDGVRSFNGDVNLFPLSMLAGIEWYSPGTVPVRYRSTSARALRGGPNAACGVLLLWTAW
jgi:hypothetical protein